jgi:GAF domain-containing protein
MDQAPRASPSQDIASADALQVWRQELGRGVLTALVIVGGLALIGGSVDAYSTAQVWLVPIYVVAYAVLCVVTFWKRVPHAAKVSVLIVLVYGLAILDFYEDGRGGSGTVFLLAVPFLAALFFGRRAGIAALVISVLSMAVFGWAFSTGLLFIEPGDEVSSADPAGWVSATIVALMLGVLFVVSLSYILPRFAATLSQSRELLRRVDAQRDALESEVLQRTRGLWAVSEVSRTTVSILDLDELLPQVVDLVRERFGLYYVGLFLLDDEGRFAILRAGTGEAGQQMLVQGHRLEVGRSSMIGRCVQTGEPDVQLDVGAAAVRFDNPLMPLTRSELALPLRSRGQIIGAMTVQSEEAEAFDDAYVAVLQTMADQVAVSIDNARLFANAQSALQEMEATQRRYLAQRWTEYLKTAQLRAYVTGESGAVPLDERLWAEVRQALEHRGVTALQGALTGNADAEGPRHAALVAPVSFRGEVIGALGIHDDDASRQWTEDDVAIVEAVIERMGIVADNLRLLDDTQRREATERQVRQVADRMRRAPDMDALIRTTVQELSAVLGTSDAFLQLSAAPETVSDMS